FLLDMTCNASSLRILIFSRAAAAPSRLPETLTMSNRSAGRRIPAPNRPRDSSSADRTRSVKSHPPPRHRATPVLLFASLHQGGSRMRYGVVSVLLAAVLTLPATRAAGQAAAPARTSDGKPNLQGIWQVLNSA